MCAIYGKFHLAWFVPVNGWFNWTMDVPIIGMSHGFPGYAITFWLIPLLYGSWRVVLLFYVAGPLLPVFFVGPNEDPAIYGASNLFSCARSLSNRRYAAGCMWILGLRYHCWTVSIGDGQSLLHRSKRR